MYKKIKYIQININPKILFKFLLNIKTRGILNVNIISIIKLILIRIESIFIVLIKHDIDVTNTILIILDPIILPATKSYSFFIADFIETNNSGVEVPNAAIVRPTDNLFKPIKSAIPNAPTIKISEPHESKNALKITYKNK